MKYLIFTLPLLFLAIILNANQISNRTLWLKKFLATKEVVPFLEESMKSSDPEIQAKATYEYFQIKKDAAFPILLKLANKSNDQVARVLIYCAQMFNDSNKKTALFNAIAKGTTSKEVAIEANQKNFSFHRINIRLKDRKDWDFAIETIKTISIPEDKWKVIQDKDATGHLKGFYKEDFKDNNWKKSKPLTLKYQPLVWYRIRFNAPEKIASNAVELNFQGVEATAWVWLNGTYIGSREEGQTAWNKPFSLDVTREIKWGKENVLVVRVSSTDTDSGIYKPIILEVLK